METATASRRSRRFAVAGVGFLLVWQVAAFAGLAWPTQTVLGILGFVFHVVFGKAYALIPAYFDRSVAVPAAVAVQLPLTVVGVAALAGWIAGGPQWLGPLGAVAWGLGVMLFFGTLEWTIRDNPTGAETGTSDANVHSRTVDRLANAAIPFVFVFLAVGPGELLALTTGVPALLGAGWPS